MACSGFFRKFGNLCGNRGQQNETNRPDGLPPVQENAFTAIVLGDDAVGEGDFVTENTRKVASSDGDFFANMPTCYGGEVYSADLNTCPVISEWQLVISISIQAKPELELKVERMSAAIKKIVLAESAISLFFDKIGNYGFTIRIPFDEQNKNASWIAITQGVEDYFSKYSTYINNNDCIEYSKITSYVSYSKPENAGDMPGALADLIQFYNTRKEDAYLSFATPLSSNP